ncbi:MAG TPA: ArsI/CadI family heavy metal resistance metalloenzyme [Streptosporangiaceae bacterium]
MSRIQLALNVDDVDAATTFYAKLFGVGPAKTRPGYANFAIPDPPLKLVLLENPGRGGTLNHLGVEVGSTSAVDVEQQRLTEAGLVTTDERGTTCCYATQDKFWVGGTPGGESWEFYTVLADSPTFSEAGDDAACCGGQSAEYATRV